MFTLIAQKTWKRSPLSEINVKTKKKSKKDMDEDKDWAPDSMNDESDAHSDVDPQTLQKKRKRRKKSKDDEDVEQDVVPDSMSDGSDEGSEVIKIIPLEHYSPEYRDDKSDEEIDEEAFRDGDDIIRDDAYEKIFVRKIMKSKVAFGAQVLRKKGERVYNAYHACFFCDKLVQHIPVHMKRHSKIEEVEKILSDSTLNFDDLRRRGDDKHNRAVVEKKEGEIVGLGKRPKNDNLNISMYGPCPKCSLWVKIKHVKQHYKKCTKNNESVNNKRLMLQVQILAGHITSNPSKLLLEEVFSSMKNDDVGMIAKNDPLIVALGESWLRRNLPNVEKRRYYTSQRMRLAAKLKIAVNKMNNESDRVLSMWEIMAPEFFDNVCLGAIKCCIPYSDDVEEDLTSPSNALKLKYDVKRLVNAKWAFAIKQGKEEEEKQCQKFLQLMEIEWGERVTKLCRMVLDQRRFEETKELPAPEDVKKLTGYLIQELKQTELNSANFWRIVALLQSRLMLYNKRRSGEIEVIK